MQALQGVLSRVEWTGADMRRMSLVLAVPLLEKL